MDVHDLVRRYPKLYHMAEAGSWTSIRKHGLLSTSALLDLYEIDVAARKPIESRRRPTKVVIEHLRFGRSTIRDQKPLQDSVLREKLVGMSPPAWYRLLNGMVFFWLTEERLRRLLGARAYRDSDHDVITVATQELVGRRGSDVRLSPINSGSTIYNPPPRGRHTFQRIAEYPFEARRRTRGRDAIAEFAVLHSIPDIREVTLAVERWRGNTAIKTLYQPR